MSPLRALFSTEIFMPRGHEVLWTPALLVLEGGANLTIAGAMLVIVWRLGRAGAASRSIASPGRRLLIALGILLAAAHLFDVWVIWAPLYWLDALVRCAAAVVAVAAAFAITPPR